MSQTTKQGSGLEPNVASLLCYVCSIVTGIIFLVLEKENKDVRFHAWQAIFLFLASLVLHLAIQLVGGILASIAGPLAAIVLILSPVLSIAIFIIWILCMVKAYQGERFKIPFIGDIAEKQLA